MAVRTRKSMASGQCNNDDDNNNNNNNNNRNCNDILSINSFFAQVTLASLHCFLLTSAASQCLLQLS